ncbi:hypothetical protein GCM10027161_02110 [Microbispora hainanensis]
MLMQGFCTITLTPSAGEKLGSWDLVMGPGAGQTGPFGFSGSFGCFAFFGSCTCPFSVSEAFEPPPNSSSRHDVVERETDRRTASNL